MAPPGDDRGEMTTAADDFAVEEAFEAYLAGRPVSGGGARVAAFAEAVRGTAVQAGRPNAALAELLATGLLVDQPSPSPRTASSRRRRRFAMIFPALLAKFLSAGAVAQAATGAGVVIVVATGAGATGVLGEEVQDSLTGIVSSEPSDGDGDVAVANEDATTSSPSPITTTP